MKRRSSHCRWIRKILALLLLSFCTASLVLMQANYGHITMLTSLVSHEAEAVVQKPKIAFLFIARNRLPLDLVWDAFFKGEKEGRFSIYVHSRPGLLLNKDTTGSAYFYGRQVNNSIQVDWGESSMIEAERILLRNALKDPFNERFAFVSDRFADTKGRYNPKMHPIIPVHNWRKGSQWAVLVRKHAKTMVNDDVVFPEFQKHCRRRSLPEFWRDLPIRADAWKEHNCIPDEHYVQTLLARTLRGNYSMILDPYFMGFIIFKRQGKAWMASSDIQAFRCYSYSCGNYQEYRREWCTKREKPAPCFLFARKFTRAAALRLLNSSMIVLN